MSEMKSLRKKLTKEQQKILATIWSYFRERKQWIPVRLLHHGHGGKSRAWSCLEELGGAIVVEQVENGVKYYHLTFLGILLTEEGSSYERLLARYLTYIVRKCADEPLCNKISSSEVAGDLELDTEQVTLLGYLIDVGQLYFGGSVGLGTDTWSLDISEDVEDLPQDLLAYVQERATANYDLNVPVDYAKRLSYVWRRSVNVSPKETQPESSGGATPSRYVDETRIAELQAINSPQFSLVRLIRLCEELNICYANACYFAVVMLTRAVLDHVPPIFGVSNFSEVANNYKGPRSFKNSMQHLDNSCRNIADAHLHIQIRPQEVIPNATQVTFANDLDVLLAEIVRILR